MKKRIASAALLAYCLVSTPAHAQLNVAVDIANLYLFRGLDLSKGTPVVSGLLEYEHKTGLYAGIWTGSGDANLGTEVDYYAGFRGETNGFSYGFQYLNYYYPETKNTLNPILDFDDYAEVSLSLGYKGVSFSATAPTSHDVAGKYVYYTLGYAYKAFSVSAGLNQHQDSLSSYGHIDLNYDFNDYVGFGLSQVVYRGGHHSSIANAPIWQVRFHLPIHLNSKN